MNKVQAEHLDRILDETHRLLLSKYTRGAEEHKTVLSEDYTAKELIDMAIEEAIDQITYLLTLKEKL